MVTLIGLYICNIELNDYVHVTYQYYTKAHCSIGADYNQQSVSVTIDPGTTRQLFTINIINDNIIECTEAFILSIEGTWCGLNSSDGRAQVIIMDDDGKYLKQYSYIT